MSVSKVGRFKCENFKCVFNNNNNNNNNCFISLQTALAFTVKNTVLIKVPAEDLCGIAVKNINTRRY